MMTAGGDGLGTSLARMVLVLAAFLAPGLCMATALHRRAQLHPVARWPMAFAWSMAVFGAVAWPALWRSQSFASFLSTLAVVWIAFAVLTGIALLRTRSRPDDASAPPPSDRLGQAPPPRSWTIAAAALIGLQALSSAVYSRPDWDDCYYLAAAVDYEHAAALNAEEPTHHEGLPPMTHMRLLSWELSGATLSHFSRLSVAALFHTLLPPLLVLSRTRPTRCFSPSCCRAASFPWA